MTMHRNDRTLKKMPSKRNTLYDYKMLHTHTFGQVYEKETLSVWLEKGLYEEKKIAVYFGM